MWPPLPNRCCHCGDPMISLPFCYLGGEDGGAEAERDTAFPPPWTSELLKADFCAHGVQVSAFQDEHSNLLAPEIPGAKAEGSQECPTWLSELVASDFSKTCARDHVCNTCGGAAFCWHCCGEHHRGHDRVVVSTDDEADGLASVGHRRDSFCIGCRVAFSSGLCAHHEGHGVVPVDAYGDRHFIRSSTGSEPWFSVLGGIETYEDEDGNQMVPLERKRSMFPEPGLKYSTRHYG